MVRHEWTSNKVRALRRYLGMSQAELGRELGVRQATISEWETGLYQPRGASARLLSLVAERADFAYGEPGSGARSQRSENGGADG